MFKGIIFIFILFLIIFDFVIADHRSKISLTNRLNKINNFYAIFHQKIISFDGNILDETQGELWIKRPNFFFWHATSPQENFLICNGKTIWFYVPILSQVTIFWASNILDDIFFILLSNNITIWKGYNVTKNGDVFILFPLYGNIYFQKIYITITQHGKIEKLQLVNKNNQFINYFFSNQNNNYINIKKFNFDIPKNIKCDDQR